MIFIRFLLLIFILLNISSSIYASLLDEIKDRGYLICGISEPVVGFANIDDQNQWYGFDVDMCKAISSAIFNDPSKVEFITTTNRSRFPTLAGGEVDVLSRLTTWSYSRDVNLGFEFAGINFYDGQGFMIRKSLGVLSAKDLDGSTICVLEGSTYKQNIDNFFEINNINYNPLNLEFDDEALENFKTNRCDVYSSDITQLAFKRILLSNSSEYIILPELISKEPLGLVVRHGDDQWKDVISWTINVMIIAEELGINSKNIDSFLNSENNEILRLLGEVGAYGDMIELDDKWAYNIIKNVGNYEEVFNKNIGPNTLLSLSRGLNKLYNNGGLLYAPPFR